MKFTRRTVTGSFVATAAGALPAFGSDMVLNTPKQFQEYLLAEVTRWGQVIKAANNRAE